MNVVAVVNTKGGVGKTTIASALAVRAAQDSQRVAMVDLDPQRSLIEWWKRRGSPDNPTLFEGADHAAEAVEALELDGWDWVFLDSPPAFLVTVQEIIQAADFSLIPIKASMLDLLATQDAVVLAREAKADFMCVLNDVTPPRKDQADRLAEAARSTLFNAQVLIADTELAHRTSFIASMTVGKSAAEINSGRDKKATEEIDALWSEVKTHFAKKEAGNG